MQASKYKLMVWAIGLIFMATPAIGGVFATAGAGVNTNVLTGLVAPGEKADSSSDGSPVSLIGSAFVTGGILPLSAIYIVAPTDEVTITSTGNLTLSGIATNQTGGITVQGTLTNNRILNVKNIGLVYVEAGIFQSNENAVLNIESGGDVVLGGVFINSGKIINNGIFDIQEKLELKSTSIYTGSGSVLLATPDPQWLPPGSNIIGLISASAAMSGLDALAATTTLLTDSQFTLHTADVTAPVTLPSLAFKNNTDDGQVVTIEDAKGLITLASVDVGNATLIVENTGLSTPAESIKVLAPISLTSHKKVHLKGGFQVTGHTGLITVAGTGVKSVENLKIHLTACPTDASATVTLAMSTGSAFEPLSTAAVTCGTKGQFATAVVFGGNLVVLLDGNGRQPLVEPRAGGNTSPIPVNHPLALLFVGVCCVFLGRKYLQKQAS